MCVMLSTSDAKYIAWEHAVRDAFVIRYVWCVLELDLTVPCMRYCQHRKGAVQLASNQVSDSNSNNLDIGHHGLREISAKGETQQ